MIDTEDRAREAKEKLDVARAALVKRVKQLVRVHESEAVDPEVRALLIATEIAEVEFKQAVSQ